MRLLLAAGLMIALLAGLPAAAQAQGLGPCSATFNDVPLTGEGGPISVSPNDIVAVTVGAPGVDNAVYLEIFNHQYQIAASEGGSGTWQDRVHVADFARWGLGLYKLVWESRDTNGELECSVTATMRVAGFWLSTPIGLTAALTSVAGAAGLLLTLKTTIHEGGRWALKLVSKLSPREKAAVAAGVKTREPLPFAFKFSVKQTLFNTLCGALLSVGSLGIMQETGFSVPTIDLVWQVAVPLTLLSWLSAWFKPVKRGRVTV